MTEKTRKKYSQPSRTSEVSEQTECSEVHVDKTGIRNDDHEDKIIAALDPV